MCGAVPPPLTTSQMSAIMINITEHASDNAESTKSREGIALMLVARMFSNEQEEEWLIQRRLMPCQCA